MDARLQQPRLLAPSSRSLSSFTYMKRPARSSVTKASVMLASVVVSRIASRSVSSWACLRELMSCSAPWIAPTPPVASRIATPTQRSQRRGDSPAASWISSSIG